MNWQENLLTSTEQIRDLIGHTKRIAVLGIKTDAQADQPSVYVPQYMQRNHWKSSKCRERLAT